MADSDMENDIDQADLDEEDDIDMAVKDQRADHGADPGSSQGKGRGKGKRGRGKGSSSNGKQEDNPKEKQTGNRNRGGRPSKVKNGERYCEGCNKEVAVEHFAAGSKYCLLGCKKAIQNLENACAAQGFADWFSDVKTDPKKLKRTVAKYRRMYPNSDVQKKHQVPHMAAIVEEHRQEEQMITDGVMEMMNLVHYQHWRAKPK